MEQQKQKEMYRGVWKGTETQFAREFSGHRFTDQECNALLDGKTILIEAISKRTGNKFSVCGKLGWSEYEGKKIFGFVPDFDTKVIPVSLNGHIFTNDERKALQDGKPVYVIDFVSKKTGKDYSAEVTFDTKEGIKLNFK